MEHRDIRASMMDVAIMSKREDEFVEGMGATARQCKHKGCTNQARKGGECFRHGANGL